MPQMIFASQKSGEAIGFPEDSAGGGGGGALEMSANKDDFVC